MLWCSLFIIYPKLCAKSVGHELFSLRTIKVHGDSDLVQYFEELWHSAWHLLRKSSLYQIGLREWKKMHLNSWWQQSWPKSNQRRRKQLGRVTICSPTFSRIRRKPCSINTRIVAGRNTYYYSENQNFCFLKSRILTCRKFFLGTKLFCFWS